MIAGLTLEDAMLRTRLATLVCWLAIAAPTAALDAETIVRQAMDHYRGQSSRADMTMTIHRPDWERSMRMQAWTSGDEKTLVRVTEPRKDAGNATLSVDNNMWTFSPSINRVIKVPSSMMGQNWMGSDFSNKDVSKSADIVSQYDHSLLATEEHAGHQVWVVESLPHEEAAVVWGREVLRIRDDWVLLEQQFWSQSGELVKTLTALEIKEMAGRPVATVMRMAKTDTPEEYTELLTHAVEFELELADSLFTLSSLRNPRQ
jgi:outer membrane lipoprotein-sorting protein